MRKISYAFIVIFLIISLVFSIVAEEEEVVAEEEGDIVIESVDSDVYEVEFELTDTVDVYIDIVDDDLLDLDDEYYIEEDSLEESVSRAVNENTDFYFSVQPNDITVEENQTAIFSIEIVGKNYQIRWQYRDIDSQEWRYSNLGQSNVIKCIPHIGCNGRQYRCMATDDLGRCIFSRPATLTVIPNTTIIEQPKDCYVNFGEIASFSVAAAGEIKQYKWQCGIAGGYRDISSTEANNRTLQVYVTTNNVNLYYRCEITDIYGNIFHSYGARAYVPCQIEITKNPRDIVVADGSVAEFSVVVDYYAYRSRKAIMQVSTLPESVSAIRLNCSICQSTG